MVIVQVNRHTNLSEQASMEYSESCLLRMYAQWIRVLTLTLDLTIQSAMKKLLSASVHISMCVQALLHTCAEQWKDCFPAIEIIWHYFHNSLWQSINNKQKEERHIFQMWTELLGNLAVSGMYSPEIANFSQICQILSYFLKYIWVGKVGLQLWIRETQCLFSYYYLLYYFPDEQL